MGTKDATPVQIETSAVPVQQRGVEMQFPSGGGGGGGLMLDLF